MVAGCAGKLRMDAPAAGWVGEKGAWSTAWAAWMQMVEEAQMASVKVLLEFWHRHHPPPTAHAHPPPQDWMLHGKAEAKPRFLSGRSAIVWSRHYSAHDGDRCDCEQLAEVLRRVPGAQRMVSGRTATARGGGGSGRWEGAAAGVAAAVGAANAKQCRSNQRPAKWPKRQLAAPGC